MDALYIGMSIALVAVSILSGKVAKSKEGANTYGAIMGIFVGGYFSNRNEIAKKLNSAVASLM